MWLTRIEADRLRNLRGVDLQLPAGLTVLFGANGQGKTSVLESVYLLATGRSFRTRRPDELVSWDGGPLRVAGEVTSRVGRTKLGVILHEGARSLLADGSQLDLERFLGRLAVVDLTGERALVLRGGPDERRRFLDRGIVGLRPYYLRSLGEYRRALQQRNALLRTGRATPATLEAWDHRLVAAGEQLHSSRRRYALELGSVLGEIGRKLLPGEPELLLRYQPSPGTTREAESARFPTLFAEELVRGRSRDQGLGHTFAGPHRDDLLVELGGTDLRRFGSSGQLRASLVALKLGKLQLVQQDRGESPVFLMDDFDSDLDESRASALAHYLHEGGFQALVATSKETLASRLGVPSEKFRIDNGSAQVA